LHNPNINKALEKLEFMSMDAEQRSLCEDRIKHLLDIEDLIETREALSKKEGEKKREIEIAKKMIAKNKNIEEIIEFTGLSEEEINNLIEKLNKK
jgi:predicted transposase/invertase (TIGR01784 family)